MTKIATLSCAIAAVAMLSETVHAAPPSSQTNTITPIIRTYVSGAGKDSNPCTATAPCLTFKVALGLTLAGGEIFVLDSANYGPVTIDKSVSITSEGAVGGVLATTGAAITVSAGASDVVNLRGLDLDGGLSGSNGIQFSSGSALIVQKTIIRSFTNAGINFAPGAAASLFVTDAAATSNGNSGILISAASAVSGVLNRVTVSRNGVGVLISGTKVGLTMTDTVSSGNTYGVGAKGSVVMVRNSTLSNNSVGITADQSAIVRVGQSTITANGTGWAATNNGQVLSYGNNNVNGNGTDGSVTTTVALQ